MLRALFIGGASILLAILAPGQASAENPAGDWIGRLGPAGLRIAVHINERSPGVFAGTFDSLDHDRMGAPLSDIAPSSDVLTFVLPACGCRFDGRWDPQSSRWVGLWLQGPASIPLTLKRGLFPPDPVVEGLDGDWRGTLSPPDSQSLPLVIHVKTYRDGTRAHVDIIEEYGPRIPVSSIARDGQRIVFQIKALQGGYKGELSADGKTITGSWTQGARTSPLTLSWQEPVVSTPAPAVEPARQLAVGRSTGGTAFPSDAEILQILRQRIDVQRQSVGIVVGVVDPVGRRIVSYGALNQGDVRPFNGDTVFEIGSITKVFTSLLLTDAVQRGEVALDDPVAKFLPPRVKVPQRGGKQITLVDLATHTSGLPKLPGNLDPKDPANPYGDYTVEQLYGFLGGYTLTRDIGSRYEYSNLGTALLGQALAQRTGLDYGTLVRLRILQPLGMSSTAITLSPELRDRMATGHDPGLNPVASWDFPALPGAGGLRSTTSDLLTFLAAELGYKATPLKAAMAMQLSVTRATGDSGLDSAIGWHVSSGPLGEFVWHDGATGGYRTFIGFDPKAGIGIVVLSNSGTEAGVNDIGFHLLQPARPLMVTSSP